MRDSSGGTGNQLHQFAKGAGAALMELLVYGAIVAAVVILTFWL